MNLKKEIWNSRIISKKNFSYLLYHAGWFGNIAKTWGSLEEIKQSGWNNCVCIRSKKGIARNKTRYNIPLNEVDKIIKKMINEGISKEELTFNQSMPDNCLTIQGEIMLSEKGIYLLYTKVKKPMNIGLKEESIQEYGLKAKALLEYYLSPVSLDEIYLLLENFPDSIVEFSSYSCYVGNLPNRNTIIWEVRNY
jgi:hypothetical protein